ncbi:12245_t:CDS:1, partial [Gigaspora margarita]
HYQDNVKPMESTTKGIPEAQKLTRPKSNTNKPVQIPTTTPTMTPKTEKKV